MKVPDPVTRLGQSTPDRIEVRGHDLCRDLIGKLSFTEMMLLHLTGKRPEAAAARMVDALLVAMVEHGLTLNAIAARMTYASAPEALQGAVAAGLLGAGSVFFGAMEVTAQMLERTMQRLRSGNVSIEEAAAELVADYRRRRAKLPGFGHRIHKPDDPRPAVLFRLARELGYYGQHCELMAATSGAVDASAGRHLTLNVAAAYAAILLDMGFDSRIIKGFVLIARCAGLVGHLYEEQQIPAARRIADLVEEAVPYRPGGD
jgi:citrate synthase